MLCGTLEYAAQGCEWRNLLTILSITFNCSVRNSFDLPGLLIDSVLVHHQVRDLALIVFDEG